MTHLLDSRIRKKKDPPRIIYAIEFHTFFWKIGEPLIIRDFLVLLGLNRSRTSVRSAILTNSRGMFIYNWT